MNLADFITDNVNIVEAYFCPEEVKDEPVVNCGWVQLPSLPTKAFKNRTDYQITEYHYRDLSYVYDTANDAQKVIQRVCVTYSAVKNNLIVALTEDTIPSHRFPCTNDITSVQKYSRVNYKYNNRIFFHVERDETGVHMLYLRYNHAYNVDIEKMSEEWNDIYTNIVKSIYKK